MTLLEKLKKRAEAGLSNKAEDIPASAIEEAITDMSEIVGERQLETPFKIDIAYYRLLLILDAHISDEDMDLYEKALKERQLASYPDTGDGKKSFGFVATGQRESDFECL